MTTRVLIVERPGTFRDELLHEMSQRGVEAHVRDDAMEALASIERLTPHVVVVSDDPGPPGAVGLCRVLQRKLSHAQVYRMGEPSLGDQLEERSLLLPRSAAASAVVSAIFDKDKANDNAHAVAPRAYEGSVGSLELGPLLIAIEARWLTGRLTLTRPGTEREIVFVRGQPVYAHSTVLADRLGAIAVRRNVLREQQVDHAVDVARARNVRLGVAMLDLSMLDSVGLMRLLAAQLLEQLTAACNGGATQARFVIDRGVIGRYPLQRMASMTGLLHAVAVMTDADLASVLDELSEQPLEAHGLGPVERFLNELRLSDAVPMTGSAVDSVKALRARLRAATPHASADRLEHPDVIALTLLRSGAFRMPQLQNPTHAEVGPSVRTLSPPSLVNAAERCAQSDFSRWPVTAITRARTPLEQAIDVSLHGKRPPELARVLALHGPEADCDERFRDVYELLLRDSDLLSADASSSSPVSEVRMRCHTQLKRVDALEAENLGGLCRAHLLQTRDRIERALALLPAPEVSGGRVTPQPPPSPAPPVGYLGAGQSLAPPRPSLSVRPTGSLPPAPPTAAAVVALVPDDTLAADDLLDIPELPPLDPMKPEPAQAKPGQSAHERALLDAAGPLLEQSRWRDLRLLLAADNTSAANLPPVLALLYAVALKEEHLQARHSKHDPFASRAGAAESIAISVVQKLFELPEASVISVLIAKRLLRRRPLDWKQKPPTRVSAMLVGSALLLGALVGFLLHPSLLGLFWK
jgi:hypothetical protein